MSQLSQIFAKKEFVDPGLSIEVRTTKKQAVLSSIKAGVNVTSACRGAQIDRRTYYHWFANDEEFAASVREAKLARIERVSDVAYECAMKSADDPRYQTSLIAWMNNEGGWGKSKIQNAFQSNVQVYIPDNGRNLSQMSDEELTKSIVELLSNADKKMVLELIGVPLSALPEDLRFSLDQVSRLGSEPPQLR